MSVVNAFAGRTWPEVFAEQVRRDPGKVAVVHGGETLTYAGLSARARALAAQLAALGVGPESVVALAVPRSLEMIVAEVGVLLAGAAYLPIDTDHPAARITYLIEEASPVALVATADSAGLLPAHHLPIILTSPTDEPDEPGDFVTPALTTLNAAYVIYTSGSTGLPKGVVLSHSGVSKLLATQVERFGIGPHSRVLHFASPSFDVAFWDLCLGLLSGGTLVVVPSELRYPGEELADYAQRNGVTFMILPPALLAAMPEDAVFPPATLLAGTERVSPELVRRWGAGRQMFNAYGPTEATVNSTLGLCGPDTLDGDRVPIGIADPGTAAHVLDEKLQPIEPGETGELYLGGPGVARGYLGRFALTAERFVADPFDADGGRLYRTGDLVRLLKDGRLDFLGRVDEQVKLRGYRIEPGEIEGVLRRHPRVANSAVVLQKDRLIGYVTTSDSSEGTERATIEGWKGLHELLYRAGATEAEEENFTGWNSSYDGTPIPLGQMRAWRRATLDAIGALRPQRVLEIGVGSGLLMWRIAPSVESYHGTDLSEEAIARLRSGLDRRPELAGRVSLAAQPADDVTGLPEHSFDTIVINSVAQYFPSAAYLTRVLDQASALLAPGGRIFLGDLRNLRLLRTMRSGVVAASGSAGIAGSAAEVEASVAAERELLLDPRFFEAYVAVHPVLRGAETALKRADYVNELSRYRYDVVLSDSPVAAAGRVITWGSEIEDARGLVTLLSDLSDVGDLNGLKDLSGLTGPDGIARPDDMAGAAEPLRVVGIPNARLTEDVAAERRLFGLPEIAAVPADPEELLRLAEEQGYAARAVWSDHDPAAFDLVLTSAASSAISAISATSATSARSAHSATSARSAIAARPASSTPSADPPAPSSAIMEFFPDEEVRDHQAGEAYANIPATEATDSALIASLRTHCAAWLPEYLIPSTLVVLPELPVLVSGKIDRASLPEPDLGATVAAVSTGRKPQTERESILCGIVASLLGLPTVGADDDFFALGGDSIVSIQVVIRAREVGLVLTPRQVFQHRTAAALALQAASAEDVRAPRDPPSGDVPLTPILRWLDQTGAQFDRFSQSMVFSTPAGLELADLESMWGAIVRKHPVLSASLRREEGVLRVPADPVAPGIRRIEGDFSDQVYRAEADGARNRLDPSAGEMTRLVWFDVPHSEGRLLVVIHHTVVDGVSWRILEADLASAWRRKELEPAGTSFRRWSEVLQSESNRRKAELGAWREILRPGDRLITPRPLDPVGDRADVHRLTVHLPTELTRSVLGVVPAAFHAEINDVLLTALALAGLDWRRRHGHGTTQGVLIALEGHGREEFASGIDLSRTLGWFTSVFPVRLDPGAVDVEDALAGGPGAGQALKRIKEQIRAVPDRGLGFGVLRYLNAEAGAELGGYDGPQISFNYLGRFGSSVAGPWRPMAGYGVLAGGFDDGMPVAPYSLEINAFTQETAEGPQLGVTWAYPAALFDEGAVRDLAGGWFAALAALVAHTVGPAGQGAGGHTPSDLTLNTLSQDEIDEFESEWDA